jgi:hypothetical protein
VEAAILDENLARVFSSEKHTRKIDSRNVALQSLRVASRLARFRIEADAQAFEKCEIGMVARHGEDGKSRDALGASTIADEDGFRLDFFDASLEEGANFAGANPVFDIGADPVFQSSAKFGAAMNHGHLRASSEEIECGFGGGILGADNDDFPAPIGMSFAEVMRNVREILAWDVEEIRQIVIARREDDFASLATMLGAVLPTREDGECAIVAGDGFHSLVLLDFDAVVLCSAAIVLEGFGASRLASGGDHGEVADLHALGGGEKSHVGGVVEKRIAEAALVQDERAEARTFGLYRAGEACGARADADKVVGLGHVWTTEEAGPEKRVACGKGLVARDE